MQEPPPLRMKQDAQRHTSSMAVFYLHTCDGNTFVEDEEGIELPNQAAARERAIARAREIMAGDLRLGEMDLTSFIEVEDANKKLLFTLTFAEVVASNAS